MISCQFFVICCKVRKKEKRKKKEQKKKTLNRYELLHIDFETLGGIFVHHQNIRVSDIYRDFERDY